MKGVHHPGGKRIEEGQDVVAPSILVIIYHLLSQGTTWQERGEALFEEQERQTAEKRLVRQLSRLGYQVELQPLAQAGEFLPELVGRGLFQKRPS